MFDPKPRVHSPPIKGNLYSFTVGGGLIEHDNPGLLHNGFAWNPNGSEFLLAHSREGRIDACEFNIEQGELGRDTYLCRSTERSWSFGRWRFRRRGFYWSAIHRGMPTQICSGRTIGSDRHNDGLLRPRLVRTLRYERNARQARLPQRGRYFSGARGRAGSCSSFSKVAISEPCYSITR